MASMPDEKKQPPGPAKTAKAEGSLLAMALDVREGKAYFGGSLGSVHSLTVDAGSEWNLTPAEAATPSHAGYVGAMTSVRRAGEGPQLVVGRYDGSLAWYDVAAEYPTIDAQPVRLVPRAHAGWIRDLCVFDDGRKLASVGDDMLVNVWDAADGRLLTTLQGHAVETPQGYVSALYTVAATPDGKHLASGDRAGVVRVWDVSEVDAGTAREVAVLQAPTFYTFDGKARDRSFGGVRSLKFSPDGRRLAVAGIGLVTNIDGFVGPCRIEIWDWRERKQVIVLEDDHKAVLNDVVWTADGREIVGVGGGDGGGVLVAWRVDDPKAKHKAKFTGHAHRAAWVETGRTLLAAGFEGVQLWDLTKLT
jgi:WD40 repeat protein